MVRNRKRKDNRPSIDEDAMKSALKAVLILKKSTRKAAEQFSVNRNTLVSRLKHYKAAVPHKSNMDYEHGDEDEADEMERKIDALLKFKNKFAASQVFTMEQEYQLAKYLQEYNDMHYGLTRLQFRKLAAGYAFLLKCKNIPPSWRKTHMAGKDWYLLFIGRHTYLKLRRPEASSTSRSYPFNKNYVGDFFANLEKALLRHTFMTEQIYNLDDTGGLIFSTERGSLVTMVGIVCASGVAVPPVYVFPRMNLNEECVLDGPPSAVALQSKSGLMTKDVLQDALKHLKSYTRCSKNNPILLIYDNRESHLDIENMIFCYENGIVLVILPPHCSQIMQPLDVSVFGPFKSRCSAAINDYVSSNLSTPVRLSMLPRLTREAYLESFTLQNITSGFLETGISPFNPLMITEDDFTGEQQPLSNETEPVPIQIDVDPFILDDVDVEHPDIQLSPSEYDSEDAKLCLLDPYLSDQMDEKEDLVTVKEEWIEDYTAESPEDRSSNSLPFRLKEEPGYHDKDLTDGELKSCEVIIKTEHSLQNCEYSGSTSDSPSDESESKTEPPIRTREKNTSEEGDNLARYEMEKGSSYKCDKCSYKSTYPGNVKRHAKQHDPLAIKTPRKPRAKQYSCELCGYKCAEFTRLKRHMMTHTGEKPFACGMCDFRTSHSNDLQRHMMVHTGEKPYACDLCAYKSCDARNLKRHTRTHTGEKPYACDSCRYRSRTSHHMNRHKTMKH